MEETFRSRQEFSIQPQLAQNSKDLYTTKSGRSAFESTEVEDLIRKTEEDFFEEYRGHFFNEKTVNFELDVLQKTLLKEGRGKIKLESRQAVKCLEKFHQVLLHQIELVYILYCFEKVKLLSMTYDALSKLQDMSMQDIDVVEELYEEVTMVLHWIIKLSYFVDTNLKLIQNSFENYRKTVPGALEGLVFKKLIKRKLSLPNSPLRSLVEKESMLKAFAVVKFTTSITNPEVSKAAKAYQINLDESFLDLEIEEFPKSSIVAAKRIRQVLIESLKQEQILKQKQEQLMRRNTSYWRKIGIKFNPRETSESLSNWINFVNSDRGLTKDDFIKMRLINSELEQYNYEEEPDKPSSDMVSLWFVLLHTFFYMMNYYGFYPTAFYHTERFSSISTSASALIISVTPITASLLLFVYDRFYGTNFKAAFLQSFVCLIAGNLLYFLSSIKDFDSIALLIAGRALIGAGGMRVMTKKYIALMLNEKFRSKYLLVFATMGHIGKSIGPGINAICCLIIGNKSKDDKVKSIFHLGNIFAFVCFVLWLFMAVLMGYGFKLDKKFTQRKLVNIKKRARIEGRYFKELIQMKGIDHNRLASEEKNPLTSSAHEEASPQNAASPHRRQGGLRKICMVG